MERIMKFKIVAMFFLILMINRVYAYLPGGFNTDLGGNMMGAITDHGVSRFSIFDLSTSNPSQDWINRNVVAKGLGLPVVTVCDNVTRECREYNDVGVETISPLKKPEIKIEPVDYFSQNCIEQGFKQVGGFPFTYKCSEDKIGFYICYKRGNSFLIESKLYSFSSLLEDSRNRLKEAICENELIIETNEPITEVNNLDESLETAQIISNARLFESDISKIYFVGFTSTTSGDFGFVNSYKTKKLVPYFFINHITDQKYAENDSNVTVYLDQIGFNLNKEIYALVFTPDNYSNIISEINNFIKTENIEYNNTQKYVDLPLKENQAVFCYCKSKTLSDSKYYFFQQKTFMSVVGDPDSSENKLEINQLCKEVCVDEMVDSESTDVSEKIYEYDNDSYDLESVLPNTLTQNYKLTKTQAIDKIKFLPNANTFQFTIERNNPNKKFILVFLQKDNEKLNIAYSNFYVLNQDEIKNQLYCEAHKNLLSFFCNSYIDKSCSVIKSCLNEYDLNFDAIDLSEFVYSKEGSTQTNTLPVDNIDSTETISSTEDTTAITDLEETNDLEEPTQTYYSTTKNTGDDCANAGLNVDQWGCVCSISSSGVKRVIAGKCRSNYGLVLYGIQDIGLVPVTYQFCYSEPSTMCR